MAKRLTAAFVDKIKATGSRVEVADGGCPGLYLVVQPSGKKSWAVRCRLRSGKSIKKTIGPWPAFSLAEAHDAAEAAIREAKRGEDPRRPKGVLVEDAVADWLKRDQAKNRSAAEVSRVLEKKVLDPTVRPCWRGRLLEEVTRADCRELVEAVADRGAPTTARLLQSHLHRFFRWSVGVGLVDVNPIADMPKVGEAVARERFLSDAELGVVWRSMGDLAYPFGPAFRLLALTGCRRDEIMSLAWSEVRLDGAEPAIELPAERVKNGRAHVAPLAPAAVSILRSLPRVQVKRGEDSALVFTTTGRTPVSGFSKAKARLDELVAERSASEASEASDSGGKAVKVAAWHTHDLRHTLSTQLNELGVEPHVVEALLNHVSGSRTGVAGVYNHATYAGPKRRAAELWAEHVLSL